MQSKSGDISDRSLKIRTAAALGRQRADFVIKNAQVFDVFSGEFFAGDVAVADGVIVGTQEAYEAHEVFEGRDLFVVPGFIDSHVHIESSLMTPARFQESVLVHGTTTVLWDPHEVANVLGTAGIEWALQSSEKLLLDVFVLLPSCVPATDLETSGAHLKVENLLPFANHQRVLGLAEVMNVPGVLSGNKEVWDKLTAFKSKIRDGHAPLLRGKELNCYLCAGIQACHESTNIEEAREKLRKGMHVLIREGSCAKDADALIPLLNSMTSSTVTFCSDDRNPADISTEGHIDFILNKALSREVSPEVVFRAASFAAARAYGFFDRGVVAPGYRADLCVLKKNNEASWCDGFQVKAVMKSGRWVRQEDLSAFAKQEHGMARPTAKKRNITIKSIHADMFAIRVPAEQSSVRARVIQVHPNQILTTQCVEDFAVSREGLSSDVQRDIVKIAVVERHNGTGNIGLGLVKGFGLQKGALAASIGHDSHNVVVIGASDAAMVAAVRAIDKMDGGIVVVGEGDRVVAELSLPIAGLMTDASPRLVADSVFKLKEQARNLGCVLHEPFLQMSFLALPVIPDLKLTDKGLVDVNKFCHVDLFL